ncbi:MAG: hypothetical protein WCE30_27805 [Mycobacterium sp.]
MGAVVKLSDRSAQYPDAAGASMSEVLSTCSDIIESAFADRMRQLGGSESDIHKLASSAAYAVFAWSAGRGFAS